MKNERQKELVKAFKALSDEQRAELVAKVGAIITVEAHPLSTKNTVMCIMQRLDKPLSMVGGFHQWKSVNRKVKKGEAGMGIFFPCRPKKAADQELEIEVEGEGEEDSPKCRFRIGYVWDISQTEEITTVNA